jgi:AAA family ATP:ADP antiporter
MVEIVWKTQVLKYFYENQSSIGPQTAMQRFFSHTNALTGLFSVILILFVSRQSEKRYGWTITALLTPTILLFFAIVFYITSLSLQHHSSSLHHIVGDPLLFLILLGAIQNIFSKAAKYSLFDPTKEKAYFSLNAEQRSKGKSAVDIMGARFGKAGGAFVQQLMIIVSGSLTAGFNTLSMLVILVCLGWSCAVILLGRFVQKYQKDVTLGLIPDRPVD